jgi:hypothetical protein
MNRRFGIVLKPVPRGVFIGLLVAYVLCRLYLAVLPGYTEDVERYKEWAVGTAINGLGTAYAGAIGVDYPPMFLYPLYVAGKVYLAFEPAGAQGKVRDSTFLTLLVKLPHLLFDLLLGGLLWWLVGRGGLWGESRTGEGWGRLAALLYLWNPAVLWDSAYWGQPDGIHSFLALAALAALGLDRAAASGALLSAAALTKPLAAPLVPLLAWAAAARSGLRGFVLAGLGGLAAAVVAFQPFLLSGNLVQALSQVLLDVEAMPNTSANAHNLWWLLGPWRDANATVLGILTPKLIGLTLFGIAYLGLVWRFHRRLRSGEMDDGQYRAQLFLVGSAVVCSFFFFSTHLHENHLFLALPLLLVVAGRRSSLAWLAAGCSVAIFLNGFLHDAELPHRLPSILGSISSVTDPHMHRPYTWLQLVGSNLNSLFVALVAGGVYIAAWRARP